MTNHLNVSAKRRGNRNYFFLFSEPQTLFSTAYAFASEDCVIRREHVGTVRFSMKRPGATPAK